MAILSSLFCILGLLLSILFAPQLRIWTWGPAMLCFAVAAFAAAPGLWKEQRSRSDNVLVILGFILCGWIGVRAFLSPAYEGSRSDLLLLSMAVSTFLSIRAAISSKNAQRILIYGLAAILAAMVAVIGKQVFDPAYSPIFPVDNPRYPSGFFAHYNYGASFLIPTSLILAAFALFSKEHFTAKILIALISLAGMAAVYFTKSRGGFVGMGAGVGVLLIASLLLGGRDKKRWFGPAVIILPLMFIVFTVLFFSWLYQVQENRDGDGGGGFAGLMDNHIRLHLFGIAFSCIGLHPLFGGGSRSFSWECFQFWDTTAMGWARARPEHVHNELFQTATDYGLIGASILLIFLLAGCLIAVSRIALGKLPEGDWGGDAWRVGGLSALAGIFIQSNFEGIFRIPPGAIMLGFCIAAICIPRRNQSKTVARIRLASPLLAAFALGLVIPLSIFGWKGSQVSRILWPSHFSQNQLTLEAKADALSQALPIWELPSLYQQRAMIYMAIAFQKTDIGIRDELMSSALADFQTAINHNPFDPGLAVVTASILSVYDRNTEAEAEFRRAIDLQGEFEPTFYARSAYARFLRDKGYSELNSSDPAIPLKTFQVAADQTDWLIKHYGIHDHSAETLQTNVKILQGLGFSYERNGDFEAAVSAYDKASPLPFGSSSHYLASQLYGKQAALAWSQRRSSDALRLFLEAEARNALTTENPLSVTHESRQEFTSYLRKSIDLLKGAKVTPSENINF